MLKKLMGMLGPGIVYAAVAVGTSHIVQSTRAGATYGLIMLLFIAMVCFAKYPTFLFGSRYTAITGKTVIDGYATKRKWFLYIFLVLMVIELTVATSAAALVTSGIIINAFGIRLDSVVLSLILVFLTIGFLALGRYKALENFCKIMVVGFFITIVISTTIALFQFDLTSLVPAETLTFDRDTTFFLVGVSGWMPTGMIGAVMLSNWVLARKQSSLTSFTRKDSDFDFNTGYGASLFLALCFVLLGYIVIRQSGGTIAEDSVGFSVQLVSLFTSTIGQWSFFLIVITIVAVMYSTLLAVIDAFARMSTDVIDTLWPGILSSIKESNLYLVLFAVLFLLVWAVYYVFLDSFATFIDFVTATGFIITPFIAYFNHAIIFSSEIPESEQPSPILKYWSMATIVSFSTIGLLWIYFRITS